MTPVALFVPPLAKSLRGVISYEVVAAREIPGFIKTLLLLKMEGLAILHHSYLVNLGGNCSQGQNMQPRATFRDGASCCHRSKAGETAKEAEELMFGLCQRRLQSDSCKVFLTLKAVEKSHLTFLFICVRIYKIVCSLHSANPLGRGDPNWHRPGLLLESGHARDRPGQ